MQFKICANCGKFHLDDGKRLINEDGKAQPIKCSCINPRIMTVRAWLMDNYLVSVAYNRAIRKLIKKHSLYEFAFNCIGEPYCEQYSKRIKDAIVDMHFVGYKDEVAELLESNKQLLKEFYISYDYEKRIERERELRE